MHGYGMVGIGWVAVVLLWLIGLAALFGIIYAAVRLAALHALKAHTRWLDTGQRGAAPRNEYPTAPAGYPAGQPGYPGAQPGYPGAQPGQPGQPVPPEHPMPPAQPGTQPGQPYPGYPGGQQYSATQPTTPLPQPGTEEPPGRPQP